MCFNREKLQNFIQHITLENYLSGDKVRDSMTWLENLINVFPYNIVRKPVEDEIYYYENLDLFNYSPIEGIKFFIENDDVKLGPVRILFYEIKESKNITLTVGENKYQYQINGNSLIDLGFNKTNISQVLIEYNSVEHDITKTIEKIKHNTLKEVE
jgi:hypothetical protein